MNLAQQILAKTIKVHPFELEGETFYTKSLTAQDMRVFHGAKDQPDGAVLLVLLGMCDESGKTIFTLDQYEAIAELDYAVLGEFSSRVLENSGLYKERENAKN
jgi:hypothetical protein